MDSNTYLPKQECQFLHLVMDELETYQSDGNRTRYRITSQLPLIWQFQRTNVDLCLSPQGAPVPTSAQQTEISDPQPRRGPSRPHHLLRGRALVPQSGGLLFWPPVLDPPHFMLILFSKDSFGIIFHSFLYFPQRAEWRGGRCRPREQPQLLGRTYNE